jgi:hypothetical protein
MPSSGRNGLGRGNAKDRDSIRYEGAIIPLLLSHQRDTRRTGCPLVSFLVFDETTGVINNAGCRSRRHRRRCFGLGLHRRHLHHWRRLRRRHRASPHRRRRLRHQDGARVALPR